MQNADYISVKKKYIFLISVTGKTGNKGAKLGRDSFSF